MEGVPASGAIAASPDGDGGGVPRHLASVSHMVMSPEALPPFRSIGRNTPRCFARTRKTVLLQRTPCANSLNDSAVLEEELRWDARLPGRFPKVR